MAQTEEIIEDIKILHLSDLLFGAEDFTEQNLDLLVAEARKYGRHQAERQGTFDYIAVCGNIVANPENFERAAEYLRQLTHELLHNDGNGYMRKIMVVPGVTDLAGVDPGASEAALDSFRHFHELLYSGEDGAAIPFSDTMFRQLKNITLIGVCCLDFKEKDIWQTMIRNLEQAMEKMPKHELDYTRRTPTLLISADSLLMRWPGSQQTFRSLSDFFNKELKISLHLFGSGAVPWLPPQPFCCNHPCLGTGPRQPAKSKPLSFNVIDIITKTKETRGRRSPHRDSQYLQPDLEITSHRMSERRKKWPPPESYRQSAKRIHLDRYRERKFHRPSLRSVWEKTLSELEKNAFNNNSPEASRLILLEGFVGAGYDRLYSYIEAEQKLLTKKVVVESEVVTDYTLWSSREALEISRLWAELAPRLQELEEKDSSQKLLLFVEDGVYPATRRLDRNELELVLEELRTLARDPRLSIVYYFPGAIPIPPERRSSIFLRPRHLTKMRLGSLDEHGYRNLVKRYSQRTPLSKEQVDSYSGRYEFYSREILHKGVEVFQRCYPNSKLVLDDTGREVAEQALDMMASIPEVVAQSASFVDTVEDLFSWTVKDGKRIGIINTIMQQLVGSSLDPQVPRTLIRVENFGSAEDREKVQSALNLLADCGIFKKNDDESYELRVFAPFWLRLRKGTPKFTVGFVACFGECDEARVSDIRRTLKEKSEQVEINEPRGLIGHNKMTIDPEQLEKSRGMIVFLSQRAASNDEFLTTLQKNVDDAANARRPIVVYKMDSECKIPDAVAGKIDREISPDETGGYSHLFSTLGAVLRN